MAGSTVESLPEAVVDLAEEAPIRVLHVDDEAGFLKSTKQILEMQGNFEVETASSVEDATGILEKKSFDVIVSDYIMPGKTGLDFLKELRDSRNNIPFIIFTGKGREEVAIKALNLGADHYVNKIGKPETVYYELAHGIGQAVESKRANDALRENESKSRTLLENLPQKIFFKDKNSVYVSCNKNYALYLKVESNEIVGKTDYDFYPKELAEKYRADDKRIMESGKTEDIEEEYIQNGQKVIVHTVKTPVRSENGNVIGILGIFWDMTKRKKREEELVNANARLDHLLTTSPTIIYTSEFRDRWVNTFVSRNIKEILGYEPREFLEDPDFWDKRIHPEDRSNLHNDPSRLTENSHHTHEFRFLHKDGTYRWIHNRINMDCNQEGKPFRCVGCWIDITERKKAEEKLEMINEKLGVVGKLTRHDIRNKLQTVKSNVYLARQMLTDDHETMKYLEEVESACEQVERILNFARTYEKLGMEELVYTDVEKSLRDAVSLHPDLKDLKVVNDCHGLAVIADSLLRQLFYNLIDNSLRHGEKVSQIRAYCEEAGKGRLKLVYEDDGMGIPKAEKEKIFNEGYGKGTGYGLYLIRKMCEVYSWNIRETGKEGKGAQFTITIPKTNESGKLAYQLN